MCSAYVWPRAVQGQDHSSRLNIVWLSPFTKFNNWLAFQQINPTPYIGANGHLSVTGIAPVYDPIFM